MSAKYRAARPFVECGILRRTLPSIAITTAVTCVFFFLFILAHKRHVGCVQAANRQRVCMLLNVFCTSSSCLGAANGIANLQRRKRRKHTHTHTEPYYHTTCVEIWFEFNAFEASVSFNVLKITAAAAGHHSLADLSCFHLSKNCVENEFSCYILRVYIYFYDEQPKTSNSNLTTDYYCCRASRSLVMTGRWAGKARVICQQLL